MNSDSVAFARQTDLQLVVMLTTTLFLFISSFLIIGRKDSFAKNLINVIQVAFSYITITTISTLLLIANGSSTGVLSLDNLPWWFNPWWMTSEILFVINFLVFVICYCSGRYLSYDDHENKISDPITKESMLILYFVSAAVMSLQTLLVATLMFFLCSPNNC